MAEQILAMMVFRILGETIGFMSKTKFYGILEVGKNCFYRLLARPEMDWRILLLSMARRFHSIVHKEKAEETNAPKCYIIDDTTVSKTGLHFEGLSRVFDHVLGKCVLGYKLLILAFFDGRSTYTVDLSIHRESGKTGDYSLSREERSMQFHKERIEGKPDYERFKELDTKKSDNVVRMIERAYKGGIRAAYALMDTWFVKAPLVCAVRKIGGGAIHVVGRLAMGKDRYAVGSRRYNVHELIALHEREAVVCRKYKCMYFEQRVMMGDTCVKIFFIRVGRNKNWDAIVTTDTHMKFVKAFEIYQIRWNIEVLIKECRQYLGLGSYQGTDFDEQIADCTLCLMTHMVLTLGQRFNEYEALGELFRATRREMFELTQWRRTLEIIKNLLNVLAINLCINVADTMEDLMQGTQVISELEAILNILSPSEAVTMH
ncbi:MAG: transposase [Prevotella sp.]